MRFVLVGLCLALSACVAPTSPPSTVDYRTLSLIEWGRDRYFYQCGGAIVRDEDVLAVASANGGMIDGRSCR